MMKSNIVLSLVGITHALQLQPSDPNTFEYTEKFKFAKQNKDATEEHDIKKFPFVARIIGRAFGVKTLPVRKQVDGEDMRANPWEHLFTQSEFPWADVPKGYKKPGFGGSLDAILRAQFLDPETIKQAVISFVGTLGLALLMVKMFHLPTDGRVEEIYFGLALAPMILLKQTIFYLRFSMKKTDVKLDQNEHKPNLSDIYKLIPDQLYDPDGTVYGRVCEKFSFLSKSNGSVSELLVRTHIIAWSFLFMTVFSFIAEMLRAFYVYDPAGKDGWALPPLAYPGIWVLCSIIRAVGWVAVIMTTHFYGQYHDMSTIVAMVGALGQTMCLWKTHDGSFWKLYFIIACFSAFGFEAALNLKGKLPSTFKKQVDQFMSAIKLKFPNIDIAEFVPSMMVKVLDYMANLVKFSPFPFEWITALMVYALLNEETIVHLWQLIQKHLDD